jgi:hypothetical protein
MILRSRHVSIARPIACRWPRSVYEGSAACLFRYSAKRKLLDPKTGRRKSAGHQEPHDVRVSFAGPPIPACAVGYRSGVGVGPRSCTVGGAGLCSRRPKADSLRVGAVRAREAVRSCLPYLSWSPSRRRWQGRARQRTPHLCSLRICRLCAARRQPVMPPALSSIPSGSSAGDDPNRAPRKCRDSLTRRTPVESNWAD